MASNLQSPTFNPLPPLNLNPNDDDLERARPAPPPAPPLFAAVPPPSPLPLRPLQSRLRLLRPVVDNGQNLDLFNNCIKLASENKINQKNTQELGLIDHLSEIVRVRSPDEDEETNFQKASCTLEAGVKIYSMRVDSTHSEAYKVLGGINRAGREEDKGYTSGFGCVVAL